MSKPAEYLTAFNDNRVLLRLAATIFIGIVVAGFLTWFMYILIQFSEQKMDESARVHILDIVRVKREENSVSKERRVERPKTNKAPPAPAAPDTSDSNSDMDSIAIADIPIVSDVNVDVDGFGVGISEGEFLPIVKVAPIYPVSAANRGIEGECMVQYTVTTTGATRNITVVEDQCSYRAFRKPSVAAAKRFKYKPRIVGGEAVEVPLVRNIFIFNMAEEESDE